MLRLFSSSVSYRNETGPMLLPGRFMRSASHWPQASTSQAYTSQFLPQCGAHSCTPQWSFTILPSSFFQGSPDAIPSRTHEDSTPKSHLSGWGNYRFYIKTTHTIFELTACSNRHFISSSPMLYNTVVSNHFHSVKILLFSSARSCDFDGLIGIELPVSMYTTKTAIDLCRFNVRSST